MEVVVHQRRGLACICGVVCVCFFKKYKYTSKLFEHFIQYTIKRSCELREYDGFNEDARTCARIGLNYLGD